MGFSSIGSSATGTTSAAESTRLSRVSWGPALLLTLTAIVVRLPAYLSARHLVYDDGVYGVSVVDMREGLVPYRDVFASQGPLHLPLLYAGDLLGLRTFNAPRVTPLLCGVALTLTVWRIALRLGATERVAVVSGLLIATSGSMIWTTGQITGDGPAAALIALAILAAVQYRDNPTVGRAVLTGVFVGAAFATKPLVWLALIPIGWWLTRGRRIDHVVVAAATSAGVWFAAALPWGVHDVWRQSVTFHTGAGPSYSAGYQFNKLVSTIWQRDAIVVVAVALGLIAAARARQAITVDTRVVLIWLAGVALLLIFEQSLYANHLAAIVLPLVVLFALRPAPMRWLAIALIVLVPWTVYQLSTVLWPSPYHGADKRLVAELRGLPAGATAISDDPGLVWRAGRSTPPHMNDAAKMRIDQGLLTTETVVAAAATPANCAVAIASFRFAALLPRLRERLADVGYRRALTLAPDKELWVKDACRPAQAVRRPTRSSARNGGTRSITRLNDTTSAAAVSTTSTMSTTVLVAGAHSRTTPRPSAAPSA
jgi:uncharacterized membrane protein